MRMLGLTISLLLAAGTVFAQSAAEVDAWYDDERDRRERESEQRDADDEAGRGALDQGLELTKWGVGTGLAAHQLYNDWHALDEAEADCGAAYNDSSAPTVPSSCAEDPACESCYAEAVHRIDFNRFYIERARCITAAHVKMANSAMSFGDSASGVHGVAGLSWQLQGKPQITQAVKKLQGTYTQKAGQYLGGLESSLKQLGQCEAEHYGERDWYQRYGWIYLNFMKAKYESAPE
jgi:hypothetical protein